MIKFWGILPYWIDYTTDGLKPNEGGHVNGLTITINPKFKDDLGLFYHELEHIKQVYRTFGLHGWLYSKYNNYKLKSECDAFIAGQLRYNTMSIDYIIDKLYYDYNLDMSKEYIAKVLFSRINNG